LEETRNDSRLTFIKGDICDPRLVPEIVSDVDLVINFAAESHVDNSISDSFPFFQTNVLGVQNILEAIRKSPKTVFLQVSTDEVYGSIDEGSWTENSPLLPNSPYAASKAAADLLARSYLNTYDLDIRITRCANNFGPHQNPEKAIPKFVSRILNGKDIELYGNGLNRREWIHVDDHCRAIFEIATKGKRGDIFNIPASSEINNLELAKRICILLGVPERRIKLVEDRKGHDSRYSLSGRLLMEELGFELRIDFEEGLRETIEWYDGNMRRRALL
jgi:dTDP-glucose 4,6-dehydratase